jgi:hypothetical protein
MLLAAYASRTENQDETVVAALSDRSRTCTLTMLTQRPPHHRLDVNHAHCAPTATVACASRTENHDVLIPLSLLVSVILLVPVLVNYSIAYFMM